MSKTINKVVVRDKGEVVLPVDVDRCQVEVTRLVSAKNMMQLGFSPGHPERCKGEATYIASSPGGGAMSVCDKHHEMGEKEMMAVVWQKIVRSKR